MNHLNFSIEQEFSFGATCFIDKADHIDIINESCGEERMMGLIRLEA
jgi:hypothetical protein